MPKITEEALDTSVASADLIPFVDVSDTTQSPQGTTKRVTKANLLSTGSFKTAIVVDSGGNGDYTTIQAGLDAVAAGTGRRVVVKDGTYTITSTLLMKVNSTFLDCEDGATIQCDGSSVTTLIKPNSTSLSRMRIRGGTWLQTNATAQSVAFDFSDCPNCIIAPTRIENFGTAVKVTDTTNTSFYSVFRDIQVFDCNNGLDIGTGGTQTNDNLFDNIRIRPKAGGAGTGIKVVDSQGLTFFHCNVEPATGTGITGMSIDATSKDIAIIGSWFEGNATNVSIASGATRTSIISSVLTGASVADLVDNGSHTVLLNTDINGTATTKFTDSSLTIQDNSDITKQAKFEASDITTATTRTYTFPDTSGTFMLRSDIAGISNKNMDATNSYRYGFASKTSNYTLVQADRFIAADASGGAFAITLPTAVSVAGRIYEVKKIDSSTNAVTVNTTSSQTIDGSTTATISSQYESMTIVSDGSNWLVT